MGHRSPEDIEESSNALIQLCQSYVDARAELNPVEENRASNAAEAPENGEKLNLTSVVLPTSLEKALESRSCKERIQRNAQRYGLLLSYISEASD